MTQRERESVCVCVCVCFLHEEGNWVFSYYSSCYHKISMYRQPCIWPVTMIQWLSDQFLWTTFTTSQMTHWCKKCLAQSWIDKHARQFLTLMIAKQFLTLTITKQSFCNTPAHDDASPYQVLLQKIQPVHRILPGQTVNKILKLCCVWPWPWTKQANIFTNTLAYDDVPLKAMTVLNIFQTSVPYVRWQRWFT